MPDTYDVDLHLERILADPQTAPMLPEDVEALRLLFMAIVDAIREDEGAAGPILAALARERTPDVASLVAAFTSGVGGPVDPSVRSAVYARVEGGERPPVVRWATKVEWELVKRALDDDPVVNEYLGSAETGEGDPFRRTVQLLRRCVEAHPAILEEANKSPEAHIADALERRSSLRHEEGPGPVPALYPVTEPLQRPCPVSPPDGRVGPLKKAGADAGEFAALLDAYGGAETPEELICDLVVWAHFKNARAGTGMATGIKRSAVSLATAARPGVEWAGTGRAARADLLELEEVHRFSTWPADAADELASHRAEVEAFNEALVEVLGVANPGGATEAASTVVRVAQRYFLWATVEGRSAGDPLRAGLEAGAEKLGLPRARGAKDVAEVDELQQLALDDRYHLCADLYLEEAVGEWTVPGEWTPQLSAIWRHAVRYTPERLLAVLERVPALREAVSASDVGVALDEMPAEMRPRFFSLMGPARRRSPTP